MLKCTVSARIFILFVAKYVILCSLETIHKYVKLTCYMHPTTVIWIFMIYIVHSLNPRLKIVQLLTKWCMSIQQFVECFWWKMSVFLLAFPSWNLIIFTVSVLRKKKPRKIWRASFLLKFPTNIHLITLTLFVLLK